MKISQERHPVVAQNIQLKVLPGVFQTISCWRVKHFEDGTIQPGSSGSPLFNPNRRIVGQLSNGPCGNDNICACNNRIGNYGRFDLSWTGGGTNSTRLSKPPQTLNGNYNYYITGSSTICSTETYSISTGQSATWSVSPYFTITPTNNDTSAIVTENSGIGATGTITAVVNGVTITKTITSCVPAINGPSTICASGTFSLNTGEAAIWAVSPGGNNFTVSSSGSSVSTFITALAPNASGTVTAYYNGRTMILPIVSCSVLPPAILGPDYVSSCAYGTTFSLSSGQAAFWSVNQPSLFTILSSNATSAVIKVNDSSSNGDLGVIIAVLSGAGGISKPFRTKSCPSPAPVIVYPNPTSDILNIEFDREANPHAQIGDRSNMQDANYDIRFYNESGNLLRQAQTQGEKVEFNLSNLQSGIYYLHIYHGQDEKPEMRQIVVAH
jgi:hypothetical protein